MPKDDPLSVSITHSIEKYFDDLNGQQPTNLHHFFISEVEKPFLKVVMQRAEGNQSKASEILGINRNTLRKKLKNYGLCWLAIRHYWTASLSTTPMAKPNGVNTYWK